MTEEQKEFCFKTMDTMDDMFCIKYKNCKDCPCLIPNTGCVRDFFCVMLVHDGKYDED